MSLINFRVSSMLNPDATIQMITERAQFALDNQVIKDSNFYIPMDTGMSEGSGISSSDVGKGRIIWNTPYIRKIYYGVNFNFSTDKNPNAQALWFEAAKAAKKSEWLRLAQLAANNGS